MVQRVSSLLWKPLRQLPGQSLSAGTYGPASPQKPAAQTLCPPLQTLLAFLPLFWNALLTSPLAPRSRSHRKRESPPGTKQTAPLGKGQSLGGLVLGVTGCEQAKAFPAASEGESGHGPPPVPTHSGSQRRGDAMGDLRGSGAGRHGEDGAGQQAGSRGGSADCH